MFWIENKRPKQIKLVSTDYDWFIVCNLYHFIPLQLLYILFKIDNKHNTCASDRENLL